MKTRRRKIICVLVCILLCASFFVVPVSAEDTEYYQRGEARADDWNQVSLDNFAFGFDEVYSEDLFNSIDRRNWQQMLDRVTVADKSMSLWPLDQNADDIISIVEYDVSRFDQLLGVGHYWSSFIFDNLPILSSDTSLSNSLNIRLNSAVFNFIMKGMVIPRRVRFSLRESLGNGNFSKPVCATRTWEPGEPHYRRVPSGFSEYGNYITNLTFDRIVDNAYNGGDLYLCIDFDITWSPAITGAQWDGKFSFGLLSDLQIIVSRTALTSGSQSIYHPELDTPWYDQPDQGIFGDIFDVENSILEDPLVLSDNLSDVLDDVSLGIGVYSAGLQNVAFIMTELLDRIPGFKFVLYFALAFGLYSFILGLAGSLVGVGQRTEEHRQRLLRQRNHKFAKGAKSDTRINVARMKRDVPGASRIEYHSPKK